LSAPDLATRTFGNEDRLPRVPLPTLQQSCDTFLAWCAPLLTADELATTRDAVASFLRPGSGAHALHAALEQIAAGIGAESWLGAFWADRYLGRRDRIALNANFFYLFRDSAQGQVERAAELVAAAVDFKLLLDEEAVPPVVHRGRPLSMEQHKALFSTTRIPGSPRDTVRGPYTEAWPGPSRARHIVVFVRGHLFRLEVVAVDGRPHTPAELESGLRAVMAAGARPAAPGASVGALTSKARAEWAESRQALIACHPGNAQLLDAVETALFCLCLEDTAPDDAAEACAHLLHGDSRNRWFDKAISFVVFADGTAGVNAEHSRLDGTTVLDFVDALLAQPVDVRAPRSAAVPQGAPAFAALEFALDADLRADVRDATASFAAYADDVVTVALSIGEFGRARANALRISPDAFAQMAFQVAHQRARGFVGATYESIATRDYRHGRTEAMRVVTPESVRLVDAMDDPGADEATRRTALRSAIERHVERVRACQAGRAPEQHLWELQLLQRRQGERLGATEPLGLYDTPGWRELRDDCLSTSSTASANLEFSGFGSTGSRCIGVSYAILPDRLNLHLSAPRHLAGDLRSFAASLRQAVGELQELLAGEQWP
jgi:carnitine O-acetyltransferase